MAWQPVAQLLIDRGADANAVNLLGDNALDVAAAVGCPEVRAYLEDRTEARRSSTTEDGEASEGDLFLGAVREGNGEAVAEMLGEGTDVDATDAVGTTALMLAAIAGSEGIAKILVDKGGADIDARDRINGWTALMQVRISATSPHLTLIVGPHGNFVERGSSGEICNTKILGPNRIIPN